MNKDVPSPDFIPPPIYHTYIPPPPPPPPPPPYYAYATPLPQQNVTIIGGFGSEPRSILCPYCGNRIFTRVETETTMTAHAIALFLCVMGFWCCAPIPYFMDSCLITKHYCPSCQVFLGQSNN